MDIQSIKNIIFPAVCDAVDKLKADQHEIKLTLLRDVFNEAINSCLGVDQNSNVSIKSMFSGRGRSWAKVYVSNDNPAWVEIKNTLNHELLTVGCDSKIFEEYSNMIDMFESAGFAWIRFISSSKGFSKFQIRTKGSKMEHHVKVRIDNIHLLNNNVVNLEGVPHKLNLESGNFLEEKTSKKEILNIPVSNSDLNNLGIQTLEDVLAEG